VATRRRQRMHMVKSIAGITSLLVLETRKTIT
jgi:hypothetical protein